MAPLLISATAADAPVVASVVGGDDERDTPSRAVDEHELVEVVVHASPVMNRIVTELAEVVDAIDCG